MSDESRARDDRDAAAAGVLLAGTALRPSAHWRRARAVQQAQAQQTPAPRRRGRKPNILVIFGDDIGVPQISAYTRA